jgi:hypothetical protein
LAVDAHAQSLFKTQLLIVGLLLLLAEGFGHAAQAHGA